MKSIIIVYLIATFVSTALGQNDQLLGLMLSQQLMRGGGSGSSSSAGLGATQSGVYPGVSGLSALGRGAGSAAGRMGSIMGGSRGLGMGMAMMGSDRMRDLMYCNFMPAQLRQYCQMMAFQ